MIVIHIDSDMIQLPTMKKAFKIVIHNTITYHDRDIY